MSRWRAPSAVLVTVVLVVGCGGPSIGERVTERAAEEAIGRAADGADVDLDTEDGGIRVSDDDGDFELGTSSELPDGFPTSFPLPTDAEIVSGSRIAEDDQEAFWVMLTTGAELDDAVAAFESGIEGSGWSIDDRSEVDADGLRQRHFQVSGEGYAGAVVVTTLDEGDERQTALQITLESGSADD